MKLSTVTGFLERFAPIRLAEDWDNVGLLLGDRDSETSKVMTCLTITSDVVDEAIAGSADLIVSHHPMPFRPLKKITADNVVGQMILKLIKANVSVYSPHTAFDSTAGGINQSIADQLGLLDVAPLQPFDDFKVQDENQKESGDLYGIGRFGKLSSPENCEEFCKRLKHLFKLKVVKFCGKLSSTISVVGIACGSAGQFLSDAKRLDCDAFITGETNFHTCLDAHAKQVSLFLLGHFGSERFAVEKLANLISAEFPELSVWASHRDTDPVQYI